MMKKGKGLTMLILEKIGFNSKSTMGGTQRDHYLNNKGVIHWANRIILTKSMYQTQVQK